MHTIYTLLAATATTTAKKKSSSSSTITFLIILILFFGVYMLFIRPRQQRMKQAQQQSRTLSVGDTVVSAGGIQGTVVALDTDVAEVEVAPGVVLTFTRRAINPAPAGPRTDNPRSGPSRSTPRQNPSTPAVDEWSVHQEPMDAPPNSLPPSNNLPPSAKSESAGSQEHDSDAGPQDHPGEQPDQHS
jgi:preprotein translocase subunit YajC